MGRRKIISKRKIVPDYLFNSVIVSKLINKIMLDGKKSIAEKIVYNAFDVIKKKLNKEPLEIFEKALDNIKPEVEVKSRRIGGATYQVPVEVSSNRQVSLALTWLINFTRTRKGKATSDKLALEILDAYNNTGAAVKKRDETHKMAEANRAFAHFRW